VTKRPQESITVAGEALIDIVVGPDGKLTPLPGGAPFNVARMAGRLGADCTFLGALSTDHFGAWLRSELLEAGVTVVPDRRVSFPTTLAMAQVDTNGAADYSFYLEGTSAAALLPSDVPDELLEAQHTWVIGGLGLVVEPIRSTLLSVVAHVPPAALVVLDPNCRAPAIADAQHFRRTIHGLLPRVDLLKASVEDIAVLDPHATPVEYATWVVDQGPAAFVITAGPNPVTIVTAGGARSVPTRSVDVVDTIGAGDAFLSGLLAWLAGHPDADVRSPSNHVLDGAVEAAAEVAEAVCRVPGATLPDEFSWKASYARG
jgi:fructokinase